MTEDHQWLLGVLADLHAYSKKYDLGELCGMIEQTRRTAVAEIANRAAVNLAIGRALE
ncbi:hypothetical protein [Flavimaricola marinus]|uniref:hypothetical protein n=1 Tax=Flavimaricola marinus TaxID=1819565 RepID=UPI001455B3E4|nr:hypothetical protein [Flavimaricola marinus]